jgi:hypothetical protein
LCEESHFSDGALTVQCWEEAYGPALALRRLRYKLCPIKDRAAFLYDAFTGNESGGGGLPARRSVFLTTHNVATKMINLRSTSELQPCDKIHNQWKYATDHYEDVAFGFSDNPLERAKLEELFSDAISAAARDATNPRHLIEVWVTNIILSCS